ncbi:YbaB/EbfC family nucleoid-associated protein [candidate division KSB1 bacterium]|nr:MAG: YbaB/EbfC family nucleoid-associated protein [candidate division KSB1 bacterium]
MKKGKMAGIFKQAQKMQEEIMKAQEELEEIKVEGSSGGGMVVVTANGKQEILDIKIEKEVINPEDKEMLEDLILAAINQALNKATEVANEHIAKKAGGMLSRLPGGMNFPGMNF